MKKFRILVVDDASFMRSFVRKGVKSGFPESEIREAGDGSQAKFMMNQEHFDLVLCDWEMPKMGGDELLQWVREESEFQDMPFILITSRGEKDYIVKAVQLKASNYIVKPFSNEKLVDIIAKVMSKSLNVSVKELVKIYKMRRHENPLDMLTKKTSGAGVSGSSLNAPKVKAESKQKQAAAPLPKGVRPTAKTMAQIRWQEFYAKCLIKEISLNSVTAVIRREDNVPDIMEMVVFDLETEKDNEISRINGFIYQLRAHEISHEAEFVDITIHFVDEDPKKQAHLQSVITALA